jgi:hypothetical protein
MLFAVTKVVLKVIAMILEHVEALVFYLPTAAPTGDNLDYEVLVE